MTFCNKNAYPDGKHDAQHLLGNCNTYSVDSQSWKEYERGYAENQPKFKVDQSLLEHCFHRLETPDGLILWRECVALNEIAQGSAGFIVLFPDGEHLHTYQHPENVFKA